MIFAFFIWVALVFGQTFLFDEPGATLAALYTVLGCLVGTVTCLRPSVLRSYPVSSMMVLGYTLAYFILPPLATLAEGKSLVNNLKHPELVFLNTFIGMCTFSVAHILYRGLAPLIALRFTLSERLFRPAKLFTVPSDLQLYVMGGLGLTAFFLNASTGVAGAEGGGVIRAILNVISHFAFVPYCTVVRQAIGNARTTDPRAIRNISLYSVLMIFVAMAINARSTFMVGVTSMSLVVVYCQLTGLIQLKIVTVRNAMIGIFAFFVATGPVSNIATAMVITRDVRADSSAFQMVNRTVEILKDPDAIRLYRESENDADTALWDERYVDNLFLSRLCNLKYADQSLGSAANLVDGGVEYMRNIEFQRALSMMPTPVLEFLGFDVDKAAANAGSGGDHLLFAETGSAFAIGGFRTGSLLGSALALFGDWYPMPLLVLAVLIFALMDAQTTRIADPLRAEGWRPVLGVQVVATLFGTTFFLTSAASGAESVAALTGPIVRGWLQIAFIYWLVFSLSVWLVNMMGERPAAPGHAPQ